MSLTGLWGRSVTAPEKDRMEVKRVTCPVMATPSRPRLFRIFYIYTVIICLWPCIEYLLNCCSEKVQLQFIIHKQQPESEECFRKVLCSSLFLEMLLGPLLLILVLSSMCEALLLQNTAVEGAPSESHPPRQLQETVNGLDPEYSCK
jgi:hypothetical protein